MNKQGELPRSGKRRSPGGRLLSMFLALCMVVTLLPVSAMAEEIHTPIGTSGEITNFAPLTETEKTVSLGTSSENLELPETLTATVRTAVPPAEDSVQDSGSPETATPTTAAEPEWEETTVNIPVTWDSPDYDMDAKGVYVFTPVIEGYIVSAPLPEIAVTVGEMSPIAAARGEVALLSETIPELWVGGVQVTSANASDVLGEADGDGATVIYDPASGTLTLDNANITNGYNTTIDDRNVQFGICSTLNALKLVVVGTNTITCPNASVKDSYAIYTTGTLEISESGSGNLTATGGTASDISAGMYVSNGLTIESGSLTATGGTATYLQSKSYGVYADSLTIEGGSLTANGGAVTYQSGESYGAYADSLTIESGSLIAKGGAATGTFGKSYGVYAGNSVSVSNNGTLTATGGMASDSGTSAGVYLNNGDSTDSNGSVSVSDGGSLTATGGMASTTSVGVYVNNIRSNGSTGSVSVSGSGKLTATGDAASGFVGISVGVYFDNRSSTGSTGSVSVSGSGKLTATGDAASGTFGTSAGVYFDNRSSTGSTGSVSVSDDGKLTATGDAASGSQGRSVGVCLDNISSTDSTGSVSVSGHGELIATGGTASSTSGGTSAGVFSNGSGSSVSVSNDGSLTATGNEASASYGVSAENGSMSIFDGTITAQSGAASSTSAGVYSGSLSVGGGMVTATGGTASAISGGVYFQYSGSMTISGGTVTAQSGTAATSQAMNTPLPDLDHHTSDSSIMVGDVAPGTVWDNSTALSTYKYVQLVVVPVAPTPNLSVADVTLDAVTVGYDRTTYKSIVITNSGDAQATITNVTTDHPSVFSIHRGQDFVAAGSSVNSWDIRAETGLAVGTHTATITVTYDGGRTATATVSITVNAVGNYTVTFNPDGGTVSETSRSVAPGTAVGALPTPIRSGSYSFDGWYTAASGGTQISASTTVSANVTYYAHWSNTGGGGSGSGGGSSSNDNSSSIIVTPPAPDKPNSPTQGEIKVPGTVDSKGNVTVSITGKTVTDSFEKALADAKKNGTEQNGITVVLHVDAGSKTGSNVTVNLPKTVQDTIIAKKIVNTIVVVDNPDIRIGMNLATVQEINKQAKSDVNITATRGDSSKLTGDAKKAIGSRPVFDLKVNYGNGKEVSSFGTGSVSVTIPYTLGANEKAGNVQAVYVDAKGKVHWLTNSVYDSVEKVLRFSTDHFSTYGIGYKQTNTAFTDIAAHWAKEDIEFMVSRGLFSGTSNTTFSPNTAMTRGMFVTALGRLANADVSSYTKSSFTDVKADAYYMGYIEWASKNNIVNGIGNGRFAPDQSITREQMAVIMGNYAKTIGYTLPKVHIENIFTDNAKISTYAKEAVKQMQMAGVISGKNGNLFDPQGTATRAEVSAVLRRFVELAISSDTAQGWSMNDSGKWMYFKDGKPLTGKQDIDGATYTFDQYGVTVDVPKNLRYTTYTVQKGDSFWSISRKLGCPMSELERLNNKSRFSLIFPGDVLRVPEK